MDAIINNFTDLFSLEKRTKYFVHALVFLFLLSIIAFAMVLSLQRSSYEKEKNMATKPNHFQGITIEAKGVVVWDVIGQRELFSKNPDLPLPLASLTKVMTVVTTDGKLDDNQEVKITKEDLEPEGDSDLVVGDTWRVSDLRDFTLLTSSNDGALALATIAETKENPYESDLPALRDQFIKEMNDTALKVGLLNSKFFNEHGLDRELDRGGAYGSAKDMATLFEYTIKNHPEILEATRYKNLDFRSSDKEYSAENTNTIINKIPNVIASKTGYTDLAGGNLVVAFDAGLNRPIIVSVLGSSEEGRFNDVLKLVKATMRSINSGE